MLVGGRRIALQWAVIINELRMARRVLYVDHHDCRKAKCRQSYPLA